MRKPCYDKQDANKGALSKQEEKKLMDYVRIPQAAGLLRCSKSCRWVNYISSAIKPGSFTEDEEDLIVKLHALLGERWSLIAGRLPGRTAHEVKNYWNSHLSMKLIRMGIDPKNHRLSQNNVFNRPQRHKHKEERHSSSPQRDDDGAANSPEDDSSCMSSKLNLDLTLCLHSSQHPTWQNEESPESITHGK